MPVARYELPDGRIARMEVPEGTTPQQAQSMAADYFANNTPEAPPQDEKSLLSRANDAVTQSGPFKVASEFARGVDQGAVKLVDLFTTDIVNALLDVSGSDNRLQGLEGYLNQTINLDQPSMEEGFAQKAINQAGQFVAPGVAGGAAMRQLPKAIPAIAGQGTTAQNVLRQLGSGKAATDATTAITSGAGAALGEEVGGPEGAMIGAILAPVGAEAIKAPIKGILNLGGRGIAALTKSLSQVSDDEASRLLAEAMIREGMSPDDVAARLVQLGDDAIPADAGNSFSRLLRAASNKIPQIQGKSTEVLNARQAGSSGRIAAATDDLVSGNIDDAIAQQKSINEPKVKELYDQARSKPLAMSAKLKGLLDGDNSASRAAKAAERRLADKRAAGDSISNIDVIDATKQQMDDQIGKAIRQGENNKARDFIRLKNIMVDEADRSIPEYKQARNLFAGDRQLEQAAEMGGQYFKLKPREVGELTRTMGASEKNMFKLGAKRAIEDKILDASATADQVKRLFGKNGDVSKLRSLFDDQASFNRFHDTMERESQFALTRRAAQGNSTTAQQLNDLSGARQAADDAKAILLGGTGEKIGAFSRIISSLTGSKKEEGFIRGLEQAGDLLLEAGVNPNRIRYMLKSGSKKMIEKELKRALKIPASASAIAPVAAATTTIEAKQ